MSKKTYAFNYKTGWIEREPRDEDMSDETLERLGYKEFLMLPQITNNSLFPALKVYRMEEAVLQFIVILPNALGIEYIYTTDFPSLIELLNKLAPTVYAQERLQTLRNEDLS
ncbi:hypothetical protein [Acinetobacter modestus]|uniref:hypothetical protein n=1 Tax=Acinetobacter modestus TaxID=1776740 RepID=UPI001F4A9C79|nr:hypothetical protein [Acinetobacter modestus]MCH7334691.1 hypothetical protein [Acinetobacter modestus]